MKKNSKFYIAIWAVLLIVFNAVVFLFRPQIPGYEIRYDARFWTAWTFIIIAFAGNLICAVLAFRAENLEKMFYRLPLLTVSWIGLIATAAVGSALMLIPDCPAWIAAIVCIVILAFTAVAVIKGAWAAEKVQAVDEKVQAQTSFIRNLTVDADSIMARAKSEPVKEACKKVYEAVRYSDPMSNEALSVIEAKITVQMDEFLSAVKDGDEGKVSEAAEELLILIGDRNRKCKLLK